MNHTVIKEIDLFEKELRAAIARYTDEHVDIIIADDKVSAMYHSHNNSFPITKEYKLDGTDWTILTQKLSSEFDNLCVMDEECLLEPFPLAKTFVSAPTGRLNPQYQKGYDQQEAKKQLETLLEDDYDNAIAFSNTIALHANLMSAHTITNEDGMLFLDDNMVYEKTKFVGIFTLPHYEEIGEFKLGGRFDSLEFVYLTIYDFAKEARFDKSKLAELLSFFFPQNFTVSPSLKREES